MFFLEYLKNPKVIGAFAPSSRYLAKKMVKPIDFRRCKCIVEYGPGTGVFTDEVVKRKRKDTVFIVIEQNERFYLDLQKRYKNEANMHIIHGDAAEVLNYLKQYNQVTADYIISGLPFTSLPKEISDKIFLMTQRAIGNSGKFITFQYTLIKKKVFLKWFTLRNTSFEVRNFPPAFVLEMKNK